MQLRKMLQKGMSIAVLVPLLSMTFLLTGCWDRTELNDLAIVTAVAIDKAEGSGITLTLQFANPSQMGGQQGSEGGGGSGKKPTITKQAEGETIFEAMSFIQQQLSRNIFWGHNQALIIGKEVAKEGVQPYVDFFAHHPDPRLRSYVYVSEGKAAEVLRLLPQLEPSSGDIARELAKLKTGMSVTIKELLQMLNSDAGSAALPKVLPIFEENEKGGLQITGTAVFKNEKMIGSIDEEVTRGVLWLRDEIHLAAVKLSPDNTEGFISFNLIRSHTKLVPKIENGIWEMQVNIVAEDDIVENQTNLQLTDPQIIQQLEELLGEKVEERIYMALNDVQQELKTDILGFADAFHRKYPAEWDAVEDDWEEKFLEVKVTINSKVYIKRLGMSVAPQGVPKEEVKRTE
nr:Ger(x)C family spore germination protein [Bacillus piscicola]